MVKISADFESGEQRENEIDAFYAEIESFLAENEGSLNIIEDIYGDEEIGTDGIKKPDNGKVKMAKNMAMELSGRVKVLSIKAGALGIKELEAVFKNFNLMAAFCQITLNAKEYDNFGYTIANLKLFYASVKSMLKLTVEAREGSNGKDDLVSGDTIRGYVAAKVKEGSVVVVDEQKQLQIVRDLRRDLHQDFSFKSYRADIRIVYIYRRIKDAKAEGYIIPIDIEDLLVEYLSAYACEWIADELIPDLSFVRELFDIAKVYNIDVPAIHEDELQDREFKYYRREFKRQIEEFSGIKGNDLLFIVAYRNDKRSKQQAEDWAADIKRSKELAKLKDQEEEFVDLINGMEEIFADYKAAFRGKGVGCSDD